MGLPLPRDSISHVFFHSFEICSISLRRTHLFCIVGILMKLYEPIPFVFVIPYVL